MVVRRMLHDINRIKKMRRNRSEPDVYIPFLSASRSAVVLLTSITVLRIPTYYSCFYSQSLYLSQSASFKQERTTWKASFDPSPSNLEKVSVNYYILPFHDAYGQVRISITVKQVHLKLLELLRNFWRICLHDLIHLILARRSRFSRLLA